MLRGMRAFQEESLHLHRGHFPILSFWVFWLLLGVYYVKSGRSISKTSSFVCKEVFLAASSSVVFFLFYLNPFFILYQHFMLKPHIGH
jgi:hypothetical protein